MKLKYVLREVDERLNGEALPLMSVSKIQGVVPRSDLMGDSGRAESIDHYKKCLPGDLVINRMAAYQGAVGIASMEGAVSPDYSVVRGPRELVNFLFYFLKSELGLGLVTSLLKGIGSIDSGAVRTPRLNWKDLADIDFEFASDAELAEAVNLLNIETSQIDLLISKKEQLIEKLLERRQSLITQAVTKGLDPTVPMKDSGFEWIGLMPDRWKLAPLWSKIRFSTGWTPPSKDETNFGGGLPWVNISDLGPRTVSSTAKTLSEKGVRESGMVPAKKGSLLFSFKLSIGQVSFASQDLFTNEAVAAFEGSPDLDLQFAYYMFPLAIPANCSWNIYGAKMLNETRIKQARILLPPVETQIEIVEYLDRETKQIEQLVEKTTRAIQILRERRQALITQVVTGKIDVRGFASGNS